MIEKIPFSKIEATGNDFIVVDARDLNWAELQPIWIQKLCHRRFGIGADGVIVMNHLQMHYFNADGSVGEMCGNGLRAVTRFAFQHHWLEAGQAIQLRADDGLHRVVLHSEEAIQVEILIHEDKEKIFFDARPIDSRLTYLRFINTGVPHVVLDVSGSLENIDVEKIGKKIRNHSTFAPKGTNVNFLKRLSPSRIRIRTYERGVEAETLSCGTGSVASAITVFEQSPQSAQTLTVVTRGGTLEVERDKTGLFLSGPAHISFTGLVDLTKLDHQTTSVF